MNLSEPLYECAAGSTPLLISMPHSGVHVPPALAARMTPAALELPDTDWHIPELYAFAADVGAGVLRATHSRYVVDLNRPADGAPLYPGQRETTVCPTETFDGEPVYLEGAQPARAEIEERLARYWQPYHERLAELTRSLVERHGRCLLWDAHSIHSTVPALFDGRLPDLNLGSNGGRSCAAALVEKVVQELGAQQRFSFVVDGRFKGGYITRHYGSPALKVDALQMEIAQSAYLVEARTPDYDPARAAPLAALLRRVLRSLI